MENRTLYRVNVGGKVFYGITKSKKHTLEVRMCNNLSYLKKSRQKFYTAIANANGKFEIEFLEEGNRTSMIRKRNDLIMNARHQGYSLNSVPAENC